MRACVSARLCPRVSPTSTRILLRDVSGWMSPIALSCRNGSAETGASVWALLWQNQQKHPESNSLSRQTHWHCHPDPGSPPEPEGKKNDRLQLWSMCACVFFVFFFSCLYFVYRLPSPGSEGFNPCRKRSVFFFLLGEKSKVEVV